MDLYLTCVIQNFNPLNAKLNPICHLLALLPTHHILHVSKVKVNILSLLIFVTKGWATGTWSTRSTYDPLFLIHSLRAAPWCRNMYELVPNMKPVSWSVLPYFNLCCCWLKYSCQSTLSQAVVTNNTVPTAATQVSNKFDIHMQLNRKDWVNNC
jgi:hypothetical protein